MRRSLLALGLGLCLAGPAYAQAPAKPPAPASAPDAVALKAAREVVSKMQGDRAAVLSAMGGRQLVP